MKHWPILTNFGMQHFEETWRKWLQFRQTHLNAVATLPYERQES